MYRHEPKLSGFSYRNSCRNFDLNSKRIPQVSDSATKFGFKLGTFLVSFNFSDQQIVSEYKIQTPFDFSCQNSSIIQFQQNSFTEFLREAILALLCNRGILTEFFWKSFRNLTELFWNYVGIILEFLRYSCIVLSEFFRIFF